MSKYVLLTDSSADLTAELYKALDVELLPLTFLLEGETYENLPDESSMKFSEVYAKLRDGANIQTSAINVETFKQAYRPFLEQGLDILYLGFSSGLSSTYSAGCIAADEMKEEFPERKILTVDTLCASLGQGMLVYHTAKKRLSGASIEEAAKFAEDTKLNLVHWFTVDDLFFLKRGGRVSAATALLGSALGIKPVLHVDNEGHLINVGKALSQGLREDFELPESSEPSRVSYFVSDEDTGFLQIARTYLDAVSADEVQKVNIEKY